MAALMVKFSIIAVFLNILLLLGSDLHKGLKFLEKKKT
jgi:hypothetical protein